MQNVECVSSLDGIENEEIQSSLSHNNHHAHQYSSKPHGVVPSGIAPTSVHELLECPVCTNSMYPPIHQVLYILSYPFVFNFLASFAFLLQCFMCLCRQACSCDWSFMPPGVGGDESALSCEGNEDLKIIVDAMRTNMLLSSNTRSFF